MGHQGKKKEKGQGLKSHFLFLVPIVVIDHQCTQNHF
jgi:hypothetical protein